MILYLKTWVGFFAEQFIILTILILEYLQSQISTIYRLLKPKRNEDYIIEKRLRKATSRQSWIALATEIDSRNQAIVWKKEIKSSYFDYKLIHSRLASFRASRIALDYPNMKLLIRSGLLRNLGGILDSRLYTKSVLGTKDVIEEYLEEVCLTLDCLLADTKANPHTQRELFVEVSQSFGHTALLLHGGATFGLYHLGVVKALFEEGLLPKVISGSSVGALIAALVCIHTNDELPSLFVPGGIDLQAFASKNSTGSIRRKITRLLTKGYLLDVKVLEDCVQSNLGDITFLEAFEKTGMILNIVVSSSKNEIPRVLNYLTSPNVLIRSAAVASASMIGLYSSVDLLAKNKDGKIFIWSAASVKFGSLQAEAESPDQRLAELFNVNHFILSQAQPYIAPFLAQGPRNGKESFSIVQKIMSFVSSELKFRMGQLSRMGLVSSSIGSLFEARIQGHITIAPPLSSMDFYTIFGNPTFQSLHYWIIKGQQSTWPYLTMIKNSTMVESKLYQGFVDSLVIKKIEERNSIKSVPEGETWIRLKKRNLSIA